MAQPQIARGLKRSEKTDRDDSGCPLAQPNPGTFEQ